jgi:hypothetical protein
MHADLWGPSRKKSIGGASYMLIIIGDYSRKVWPYLVKHKYEDFDAFRKWIFMIEKQTKKKVKLLCTNCRGISCRKNTGTTRRTQRYRTQGAEHVKSRERRSTAMGDSRRRRSTPHDRERHPSYPGSGPSW